MDESDQATSGGPAAAADSELRKALEELERLNLVMRRMNSTLDLDEVLDLLISELEAMFSFEGIAILLLTDDRRRLRTRKLRIPSMDPARVREIMQENESIPVDLELGGGVAHAVLLKEDYYFNDIDPEVLPDGPNKDVVIKTGLRSVLIMPLLVADEAIGVMMMSGYSRCLDFGRAELQSIRRFVAHISQAVKNSQTYDALQEATAGLRAKTTELEAANRLLEEQKHMLEQLSRTDDLTGVRNRRAFFERAEEEIERCRRFGSKLFLYMIDIDDFKQINDRFGHDSGDAALIALARILERVTRKSDLLARYGGEEFVIASLDNDSTGAAALAERIRSSVEAHPFEAGTRELRMTVSVGYACFPSLRGPQSSMDAVLKEADQALYQAKAAGKNRCVLWQEEGGGDGAV